MKVYYDFEAIPQIPRPVATIGSYDGVHRGHQEILASLQRIAKERGGESVVITFSPHPRQVLQPDTAPLLIDSLEERLALLAEAGVEHTVVVRFTHAFSKLSSLEFVERFLVGKLHMDTLMVGFNHHLGRNKEGDVHSLTALSQSLGFRLEEMPRQEVAGEKVSSTLVRNLVAQGEMQRAAACLGRAFTIHGELTLNGNLLLPDPTKLLPPAGKYLIELTQSATSTPIKTELTITPQREILLPNGVASNKKAPVKVKFV